MRQIVRLSFATVALAVGTLVAGTTVDPQSGWYVVDREGDTFTAAAVKPYPGLVIHGPLAIDSKISILLQQATSHPHTLSLGPDAGDTASITLDSGATLGNESAGQRGLFYIGENGGWGSLTCNWSTLQFYELRVCADAAVPDADAEGNVPKVLTLNESATVQCHYLSNFSPKPVRVLFNGGVLSHSDGASGAWFETSAGDIVLEVADGKTIELQSGGHSSIAFSAGTGRVVTKGAGDLKWWTAGKSATNGGALIFDRTNISLGHQGNVILVGCKNGNAMTTFNVDSEVLTGDYTGEVHLRTRYPEYPTWMNLGGMTVAVNGIVGDIDQYEPGGLYYGIVSNRMGSASQVATLVVGKYRDGRLANLGIGGRRDIQNETYPHNLIVRQLGHVMTVKNSQVQRYVHEAGTLVVCPGTTFDSLVLEKGTTLVADGVVFDVGAAFVTDNGASFEARNGGAVIRTSDTGKVVLVADGAAVDLAEGEVLVKTGTGAAYLNGEKALFNHDIHVAAGTLGFTYNNYGTNEWWRLVMKKMHEPRNKSTKYIGLDGIMLSDEAGRQLRATDQAHNLTYNKVTKSGLLGRDYATEADMPNGSVAVSSEYELELRAEGQAITTNLVLHNLFRNNNPTQQNSNDNDSIAVKNREPDPTDPASWVKIVWRNPKGLPEAKGYSLKECWATLSNPPTDWSVETSPNGRDWFVVDEKVGEPDCNAWWQAKTVEDLQLFRLSTLCDHDSNATITPKLDLLPETLPEKGTPEYAALTDLIEREGEGGYKNWFKNWPGWCNGGDRRYIVPYALRTGLEVEVLGLAAGVKVQVDSGARFVLGNARARDVSSLVVDCALGGGTIDGLAVAESGVLELVNVADPSAVTGMEIPLELANATGTENFRSWSLMVNERPSGGIKLKFADGKLKVVPGGLLLILK